MEPPQTPRLDDLVEAIDDRGNALGPLEQLPDAVTLAANLQEVTDELVGHFADRARSTGISWAEIGDRLGVTKQGAQNRFASGRPKKSVGRGFFPALLIDEAGAVVSGARRSAGDRRSDHIGTEHLIVALIEDTNGFAARAVEASGGLLGPILTTAIAAMDQGPPSVKGHIPLAADTRKALEQTLRESPVSGDRRIDTGHLLPAILRDRNSPGGRLLTTNGTDRSNAATWIERHRGDSST